MRSYTVHRRRRMLGKPEIEAETTVLVRDGFAWTAFLVPVLWALYHRLWLVLFGYLAVVAAVNLAIAAAGYPDIANGIAILAIHVLFAAEAHDLRRWTLARRGHDIAAVIVAKTRDEAETRYFRNWCETISAHQAAHAAGDNMQISFRARAHGPAAAAPAPAPKGEKPA